MPVENSGRNNIGRNYMVSLSFANLVYLRAWADLIPANKDDLFLRKTVPSFNLYFALVGDVIALSLLIFAVLTLAPKMPGWLRRMLPTGALAVLVFAISFLRNHLPHQISAAVLSAILGVAFLALVGLTFRFPAIAARTISGLALAATPCIAVTFLAPLYYLSRPSPLPPDPPLASRLPGTPPVRVLWIVFDDWDQRLTFANPDDLPPIPKLRKLAEHSFATTGALAAQAHQPVSDMSTVLAIPSLLYGKEALDAVIDDPARERLIVSDKGDSPVFGAGDSVFARLRAQGWNSAAAGWYLPYCRVFASQLTDCYWDVRYDQATSFGPEFTSAAVDETRMLLETDLYSPFGPSLVGERHFSEYEALLSTGRRYAADPSLGLAFLHFNVPHAPYIYNAELGRFGRKGHPNDLYVDGLKWVDRAVNEILSSLSTSGLDSRTALIISSDHPARLLAKTDPHVPFIVHLPGEEAGRFSTREFSALGSADLVLGIATGGIKTPEDVEKFLLHRR